MFNIPPPPPQGFQLEYHWHGTLGHFHQAIRIIAFTGVIFHLCPNTKVNSISNVRNKTFLQR